MPNLKANGITIEYDEFGPEDAGPMLLISGLGVQMIRWRGTFCQALAYKGFRVIRFDNRDAGLSTHFDAAPAPDFAAIAGAIGRGERPNVPYTLHDMADDAVNLLDGLNIGRAHLVGRSMGGMIAQLVASKFPERTLSLSVIMSSTGNPGLPTAPPEAMDMLTRAAPDPSLDEAGFLDHCVATARFFASPAYPFDEVAHRALALAELRRAYHPTGFARQIAAIAATGDLRPWLKRIQVPTLVVHGTDDKLVPERSGRDIADNIMDAELMLLPGMGHDLPSELYDRLADAIATNAVACRQRSKRSRN